MPRTRNVVSVELEQKLIDGVRDNRCIWDKTNDYYKNTTSRDNAWTRIAASLDMEDGAMAKTMWESLRGQFSKFRNKVKKPTGSAGGRRPSFRHEEAMGFLIGTLEPDEETYSNLNELDGTLETENDENEVHLTLVNSDGENQSATKNISTPTVSDPKECFPRSHSKFQGKRKLDKFDEELLKIMESGSKDDEDEYEVIGRRISKKLRGLGQKDRRVFLDLEFKINSLIHEAEMGQI